MRRHNLRRAVASCAILAALLLQQAFAQQRQQQQASAKKFELTVDSIMRGPDLVGYQPTSIYWSQDSRRVFFRWKRAGEPRLKDPDLYVVESDGTGLRKLTEEEARQAPPAGGELSKDKTLTVFADEGDIFLYDHAKRERRALTKTFDSESNPHFTRDQHHVYFTRQSNLYVISLDGGSLEQLTDIRVPTAPGDGGASQARGSAGVGSGVARSGGASESQEFVRKEERQLIEAVRERAEQREEQEKQRRERDRRRPFTLTQGQTVASLLLSPDGSYVVATINEPSGGRNTIVPNFVTESGYTEDIQGRTKVGDLQGRSRIALVSVETGEVRWVETGLQRVEAAPRVQTRTEQNATESAERERGVENQTQQAQQTGRQAQQIQQGQAGAQSQTQTGAQSQQGQQSNTRAQGQQTEASSQARDREVQLFQFQWSDDGTRAVLMARAADNKDRWIMSLDPATAKTRVLVRVHDDAWVGGPGSFTLGWLPDNRRVYFVSERDGWAHLYTVSTDGGQPSQLTSGKFEVSDVRLSADKTKFYFTSSEGSFFERHLYTMPVEGGARTRLTTMPGNNQVDVSPDETLLAVVRSYSNKPPELYIQPNRPAPAQSAQGANANANANVNANVNANAQAANTQTSDIKQVTTSPTPEFFQYDWIDPPIVSFRARDGATVYGRLYKPSNFRRGGPAVIFVHGAGYLQDVTKSWSSYYREYMFHHLLMERGFTVLSIDYRGSAGYGRDWRVGIYRHMGGKDLDDHVDAVRYLVGEHGVDPKRVGIYGGSYGGFITLMAMFMTPDIFAAGAALRPVSDWAHYNHPYTSNILNDPQDDPEAYRRSSPIYFAEGLKGHLLICHGMVDTNVNFQDTVRLIERLIELRKENWEVAPYPVEDHTFDRADSWADEYKRILKLFSEQLRPDAVPPAVEQRGNGRRR